MVCLVIDSFFDNEIMHIDSSDGNRRYGLRYVGMSSALRDEITRHVFRIQRERLAGQKAMSQMAPAPVSQHLDTSSDDS